PSARPPWTACPATATAMASPAPWPSAAAPSPGGGPRARGLAERFQSRVLPLEQRHTAQVGTLLPELYLHGLSSGDFDLALRGLLGEAAPLAASALDGLQAVWQAEYRAWKRRPLAELEVVYLGVDGTYVKAGLEEGKAAVRVAIAALRDGRKVVLAVEPG